MSTVENTSIHLENKYRTFSIPIHFSHW
jgi:hypothetical protein